MPVDFLTDDQYQTYAKYPEVLTQDQLDKYFYLDDKDKDLIDVCRRDYNKLGYAIQLTTVRFLGTFLSNPIDVYYSLEPLHFYHRLNFYPNLDLYRNYMVHILCQLEYQTSQV